jgi:hypothetical protein
MPALFSNLLKFHILSIPSETSPTFPDKRPFTSTQFPSSPRPPEDYTFRRLQNLFTKIDHEIFSGEKGSTDAAFHINHLPRIPTAYDKLIQLSPLIAHVAAPQQWHDKRIHFNKWSFPSNQVFFASFSPFSVWISLFP